MLLLSRCRRLGWRTSLAVLWRELWRELWLGRESADDDERAASWAAAAPVPMPGLVLLTRAPLLLCTSKGLAAAIEEGSAAAAGALVEWLSALPAAGS